MCICAGVVEVGAVALVAAFFMKIWRKIRKGR